MINNYINKEDVNMKIKEQVVSLELSGQLKEAGYPQKGIWWWGEFHDNRKGFDALPFYTLETEEYIYKGRNNFVAPTVTELGKALSEKANVKAKYWLYLKKQKLL